MSNDDKRAKDVVIKTLEDQDIKKVKFGVSLYDIDSANFAAVLKAVRNDKISVRYDPKSKYGAYYNAAKNEIALSFTHAPTWKHNALIVHECVHAAMDVDYRSYELIDHLTSEAAGFIAQCMFKLTKMTPEEYGNRLGSRRHAATDKIFRAAWSIALAYHTGGRIRSSDWIDLEAALKTHPGYASKSNEIANFDGVHKRADSGQHAGHHHHAH